MTERAEVTFQYRARREAGRRRVARIRCCRRRYGFLLPRPNTDPPVSPLSGLIDCERPRFVLLNEYLYYQHPSRAGAHQSVNVIPGKPLRWYIQKERERKHYFFSCYVQRKLLLQVNEYDSKEMLIKKGRYTKNMHKNTLKANAINFVTIVKPPSLL